MSTRIDYAQIAAKLDYAALEKKLAQLAEQKPPRSRKTAADLLEPLRERLLLLQRNGWSSRRLAGELKAAGLPVSPASLRECLNRWKIGENKSASRRRTSRGKRSIIGTALPAPTFQSGRSKAAADGGQAKLSLPEH